MPFRGALRSRHVERCVATQTDVAAPEASRPPQYLAGKKVIVVGAGPGGMAAALQCARHGATVDVFEQRPPVAPVGLNAWVLVLSQRGLRAMKQLGISCDEFGPTMRCAGVSMQPAKGKPRFVSGWGSPEDAGRIGCDQPTLASFLQKQALALEPDRIKLHFHRKLLGGDLANRTLVFEDTVTTSVSQKSADLIIGADGGRSRVRALMTQQAPGFTVDTYPHFSSTLAVTLPPVDSADLTTPSGGQLVLTPPPPEGAESWYEQGWVIAFCVAKSEAIAGSFVLLASPRGEFQGLWSMPHAFWHEKHSEEELYTLLSTQYPQLPTTCVRRFAAAAAKSPEVRRLPSSIKCSSLAADAVLLVGDAGHGISPATGQGAQSALEDSICLGEALAKSKGNILQLGKLYSDIRLPDVQALVDLDRLTVSSRPLAPTPGFAKKVMALFFACDILLSQCLSFLPGPIKPLTFFSNMRVGQLSFRQIKQRMLAKVVVMMTLILTAAAAAITRLAPHVQRLAGSVLA